MADTLPAMVPHIFLERRDKFDPRLTFKQKNGPIILSCMILHHRFTLVVFCFSFQVSLKFSEPHIFEL